MEKMIRLRDKVALVTGGSRTIGRTIALGLARQGAEIVVNYVEQQQAAEEVKGEIEKMGRKCLLFRADVGKSTEVNRMVETAIKKFGKIDILVNNAAIGPYKKFLEVTEEFWDRMMEVNIKGPFLCSQAVARHMIKQGAGKIINISSTSGEMVSPGSMTYSTSKGGLNTLTKGMALELAPYKINVNAIAPGVVETDGTRKAISPPAIRDAYRKAVPLGRITQTDDLIGVVVFLASEESRYITGEVITIDGGWSVYKPEPGLEL